ncbi:CGNR zinc finger domain-containing protein [Actinacidiphila sp. bgisy144]|uniref:CGNR zinc finger domain-containing protein n=1 Tax=Actinacidiphila sp. bgisy144 TaxID=3413791 RepID=UPI003EBCFF64
MNLNHVFVCEHPALDFAATLRARRTTRFDMFPTPDRLDAWYTESGTVDAIAPSQQADLDQAITLREAIYTLITTRRNDHTYEPEALDLLNSTARTPSAVPQITPDGHRHTIATPQEALSTIARQTIQLLTGPHIPLLKECSNPECTRIYIDHSRGNRRQWCGMQSCGNKIKAANYRARKKNTQPHPTPT